MSFFVGPMNEVKFNAMVAGDCGAGKSTFIQTFSTPFVAVTGDLSPCCSIFFHEAPEYDEYESIDDNALALQNLIVAKHRDWIKSSTMLVTDAERNAADNRIHCLFYFFGPHRIREADRKCLSAIAGLVPIVPVIAKADSLTNAEREHYLREAYTLMNQMQRSSELPVMFDFMEQAETVEESPHEGFEGAARADGSFTPTGSLKGAEQQFNGLGQSYVVADACDNGCDNDGATAGEPGDLLEQSAVCSEHHSFSPLPEHNSAAQHSSVPRLLNIFALVCSASESGLREYPWGCSVSANDERVSDFRRLQRLVFERGNIARLRDLTQQMTIALHRRDHAAVTQRAGSVRGLLAKFSQLVESSASLITLLVLIVPIVLCVLVCALQKAIHEARSNEF